MPSRIIRQDILTSERVEQLDPPAEVFYRRLLSVVDDHGLFDARASILRSALFPLRLDRVREADCTRWMAACQKAGLIVLYSHDGKPYGQALNTRWTVRGAPKYPLQATVNTCTQMKTNVPVVVVVDVGVDGVDAPPPAAPAASKDSKAERLAADWGLPPSWGRWAVENRPGVNVTEEAAKFADYWHAQPVVKGRKLDWLATWRNWIRNARVNPSSVTPNPAGASPRVSAETERQHRDASLDQLRRDDPETYQRLTGKDPAHDPRTH